MSLACQDALVFAHAGHTLVDLYLSLNDFKLKYAKFLSNIHAIVTYVNSGLMYSI